ncbi:MULTISPECIES: hypothetical protein [Nocardiopsis]|uniref:Uncharacterized protein n=1 Tax=Nocardiopsis sinuspersici TaxID=501010 RepID=A0A1V3C1Z7_9ACTN|nr:MULTISPECIES: hypothetical protein [Nocardiopsis]OOC54536.1 hypothetical protein NOSIN_12555 [Nocardiopsis sinuspersici]
MGPGQTNYNPAQLAAKFEALLRELPAPTAPLPERRKPAKKPGTAKRLMLHEVNELITAYQAGTNVYKLGEHFISSQKSLKNPRITRIHFVKY